MQHTLARRTHTFLALWVLCFVPVLAHAQVTPLSTWIGGQFPNTLWQHPNLADDGLLINCAPGTAGCTPLNLSMCNQPGKPISFVVAPPSSTTAATYTSSTQTLYAFISTQNNCIYSTQVGGINNNPNYLIGSGAPIGSSVFFGGVTPFVFPTGGLTPSSAFPNVTTQGFLTTDLLNALGACPPDGVGVQLATYYICVGVDATQSLGINNGGTTTSTSGTTSGGDPFAYVQLQIDTIAPATPSSVVVQPLDSRCDVTIDYDTTTLDAYYLQVKATADPANLALIADDPTATCDAWVDNVVTHTVNIYGETSGTETVTINGDNGVLYGFCVETVDYMQNVSVPSTVSYGRPRPECDLFKCYPDVLQTGFCGASLPPSAYGLVGALSLWRACRRRRHTRVDKTDKGPTSC